MMRKRRKRNMVIRITRMSKGEEKLRAEET
jgi:hypothetical protein